MSGEKMSGDKTVRIAPPVDATLVRPRPATDEEATRLQSEQATERSGRPSTAPAATLERTEVIRERLVKTLDRGSGATHGPLNPGDVIKDRFVLEAVLGKGGMGIVFGAVDRRKEEARDPNPRVALKVLNADFERHPHSFMALQREARKAQTLAHPNVVTVFDFDRDGDVIYMTMEMLKGRPLEHIVREARGKGIGREAALPIVRGIAEGLAYAHRKGIVHSDLKPGNVFILEDGTAKILDFGIARAVPSAAAPTEAKDVFDAGELGAYTEAYATAEMVKGVDPHPADDMYALGIIAYELITGTHPYMRHSAPSARNLDLKPAPLKGLKRKHARAIERCLSFDRKRRPQDASEFLKAFRGVTRLQKISVAAAASLALVAGYVSYQNYVETSPAIAFSDLPAQTQQDITAQLQQGDEAWRFFEQGQADAIESALAYYANAYDLHPRNRTAVAGLNRVAEAVLAAAGEDPDKRREAAEYLQQRSPHFRRYAPVVEAAN